MRAMKDSGNKLIGFVPQTWEKCRLKYIATLNPTCTYNNLDNDSEVTFTPMECIGSGKFENRVSTLSKMLSAYTPYQEGDIVIAKVTPCFENGNTAVMRNLYNERGFGSSELFVFRPKAVNTTFLYYFLQNEMFKQAGCSTMTGTGGLKRVSPYYVRNCPLFLPSNEEQRRIASYLDSKCSKIDGIVAKQQQLIEKLKAYKQTVITEAVTKGLNPNVPMKDSGIEWIGEIPKHWAIKPFKYVLKERLENNRNLVTRERLSLSIGLGVTLYSEKTTNLDRFKDDVSLYKIARKGDLVMNSMNVIVGAVGVTNYTGCVSPAYYTFYDDCGDHVVAKFCEYVFLSPSMRKVLFSLGKGIMAIDRGEGRVNTCRLKVSKADLGRLGIALPPLNEIRNIVIHIKDICVSIDNSITRRQQLISKLQEYKKSLIYEVVTGKREVPNV